MVSQASMVLLFEEKNSCVESKMYAILKICLLIAMYSMPYLRTSWFYVVGSIDFDYALIMEKVVRMGVRGKNG